MRTKEVHALYYAKDRIDVRKRRDMDKTEAAAFAFSEREPQVYWLARVLLLAIRLCPQGGHVQARATCKQEASPTVIRLADDGIVEEAKARIANSTDDEESL